MRFRCLHLVIVFLAGPLSAWSDPAVIKAKTEEPVVEELMGGCSLKCAFDWQGELLLPGEKKWQAVKVFDDDSALTAWTANDPKVGIGLKIRLIFPKKLKSAEMEGEIPLYGFDLINGRWHTEEQWTAYARIKRLRVYYNDKPFRDFAFADSRRWQRLIFPDIFVKSGDVMTLEVIDVYPGKTHGLAISEIVLEGAH